MSPTTHLKVKLFADGADLSGIKEMAGNPAIKGSVSPFSELPVIHPFALIQNAALLAPPGSAPKSVLMPFLNRKA